MKDQVQQRFIQTVTNRKVPYKFIIVSLLVNMALFGVLLTTCLTQGVAQDYDGEPSRMRIVAPASKTWRIEMGNSRVLEFLFYSGIDDRNDYFYRSVTKRDIALQTTPKGIIDIDIYGRIQTLAVGSTILKVRSESSPHVFDQVTVEVIPKSQQLLFTHKQKIVNYRGRPAQPNRVLQKMVYKLTGQQALKCKQTPLSIRKYITDGAGDMKLKIIEDNVIWEIVRYADGSNRSYVKRTDNNSATHIRDRLMHLMGDRYLPDDGLNAQSLEVVNHTLWIINHRRNISRISFVDIDYKAKAEIMVENTQKDLMRYGLASGAAYNDHQILDRSITDNDALWTELYGAGELMRYATLKQLDFPNDQIAKARKSAFQSLKAVLMISNIPLRNKTMSSTIRHLTNTIQGANGIFLSQQCLRQGRSYSIDNYVGSAADGFGHYGIEASKHQQGKYFVGGKFKYSFQAFNGDDWNGFMARTFVIEKLDRSPGGLLFKHNKDGTQTVINGADVLYDYTKEDTPILDLGSKQLPDILKDYLKIGDTQYTKQDIIYKGDTSTDSIIAHLFIYKIAFDILDQNDQEQQALKQLILSTITTYCTSLVNNGYNFVDATGHGTKWGKITRDFIISDYNDQDAPLKALQLLMAFKLCHYITGDSQWKEEYELLIEDPSYKYLEVVASVWSRWKYIAFNFDFATKDHNIHFDKNVKYSQAQVQQYIIYNTHFSDEEEAFLAFYLAFQLEDNPGYLSQYRQGLEGWWHSTSRSQNPLWYYIYQLAYPHEPQKDGYHNNILQTASWALSRHSIDTKRSQAFIEGSRDDVLLQGSYLLSFDPFNIIGQRMHAADGECLWRQANILINKNYDARNIYELKVLPGDERSMHKLNVANFQKPAFHQKYIEPSTTYTLPYWFGVYHKMLSMQ